jgi:GrpB-like predicted nucleotidyltransferase (UPF0157 family)/8-oxo-dGTP pyrophosphatase MutT (NUDIX family)
MTHKKQVIAAGAFIFDKEGKVFLAKFKNKFNNQWSIPGGKLEFGESALEAVIREVKEETNIDIHDPEFLEHGSFVVNDTHVIYIDYMVDCPELYEVHINDEFSDWGFFTREELDTLDIIPKTKLTVIFAMQQRSKKRWVRELSLYNLGLIRKTVSVHEPQDNWVEAHQWVRDEIRRVLDSSYRIESIGSTIIPGLAAKPILDILLVYSDSEKFKRDCIGLEELGFTYKGDAVARVEGAEAQEDRHFFSFYNCEGNVDYVHLHALPRGDAKIEEFLKFRDRLCADVTLRMDYRNLKKLFREKVLVRHEYTRGKKEFVAKVLSRS